MANNVGLLPSLAPRIKSILCRSSSLMWGPFEAKASSVTTKSRSGEIALVRILVEPKNALVKQYQQLFSMEGALLDIREEALQAIARRAMARKTGARGLRTIMESTLLNSMYELPSLENVSKIVVDESVIDGESEPFIVYENVPSSAASGE